MKNIITSTILLLALLLPLTATAYDFAVDGICYNIHGNEAAVTSSRVTGFLYIGFSGSLVIPATVTYNETTYPVTSIEAVAFWGSTRLTSIDIPNSVTEIGQEAFGHCPALTSIVVESGNPRYDSRNNCNAIIETTNNVLIVGCKNTTIPNSVTAIGDNAFHWCTELTSIDIPNSVTTIGVEAFRGCTGLTSIDIPNSVTEIGGLAFYMCSGLTSVDIPNSVTEIGYGAFSACYVLTSIVIPNSVTSIGDRAFCNCRRLTDVYCYIADLSKVSSGYEQFSEGPYSVRTLHVLQGMADAYRADENWYPYFGQIVEDLFRGDVNGDREVNIADVNAVISMIMVENGSTSVADVNGDGEINIADINSLIDTILSGNNQ